MENSLSHNAPVLKEADRAIDPVKVVFLSNWFNNPYKQLLTEGLENNDILVEEQIRSVFFLGKVLSGTKPNILHLQTLHYIFASQNWVFYWFKFLLFSLQISLLRLLGVKTIWTVHEWKDKISKGKHDLSRLKAKILGKVLTGIIVHCETTRQEIISDLALDNSEKVFVIAHGNYIECYENTLTQKKARETLGISQEAVSFLFFGGIHPAKGVLDAIEAFKGLHQEQISSAAHLTIAGKRPYLALNESIQAACINHHQDILLSIPEEGISEEDVQLYLNACDVVVLPYRVFTTSGVALLAMSFKRACIAPDHGFFKDTLDEKGSFLYDQQTPDGLQNALRRAIENRETLTERGLHNYEIAEQFSWPMLAKKTADVYAWAIAQ